MDIGSKSIRKARQDGRMITVNEIKRLAVTLRDDELDKAKAIEASIDEQLSLAATPQTYTYSVTISKDASPRILACLLQTYKEGGWYIEQHRPSHNSDIQWKMSLSAPTYSGRD